MTAAPPVPYLVRITLAWAVIAACVGDIGESWRLLYLVSLANLVVAGTVYFFWNRSLKERLAKGIVEPVKSARAKFVYPQFLTNLARGWFGSIYTGAISLGIYCAFMQVKLGIIFFLSILIHELGHYASAKYYRLQPQLPKFIPFVGAYVLIPDENLEVAKKAWFAFWGPLAGSLCLIVLSVCFFVTGDRSFLVGAFLAGLLNLMQLIPTQPFDGGHVVQAITPRVANYAVVPALAFSVFLKSGALFLIICLSSIRNFIVSRNSVAGAQQKIEKSKSLQILVSYLALVLFLAFAEIPLYAEASGNELLASYEEQILAVAFKLYPSPRLRSQLGITLVRQRKYAQAEIELRQSIKDGYRSPHVLLDWAGCILSQGKKKDEQLCQTLHEALSTCEKQDYDADDCGYYLALAGVYDQRLADKLSEQAQLSDGAIAAVLNGDQKQAQLLMDKRVSLEKASDKNTGPLARRATNYLRIHNLVKAEADIVAALQIDAQQIYPQLAQSWYQLLDNKVEAALKSSDKLIKTLEKYDDFDRYEVTASVACLRSSIFDALATRETDAANKSRFQKSRDREKAQYVQLKNNGYGRIFIPLVD